MLTQKLLALTATWGAEWVNWVLVAVSVTGLAVLFDRLALYLRTPERFDTLRARFSEGLRKGEVEEVRRAIDGDSLVRNVLRAGLDLVARGERGAAPVEQVMLGRLAEERARYEARLSILTTIGNTAPLVGLLGTVIGIVGAFYLLGKMGSVQAQQNTGVMASIGEALVTTGFSIAVAVPAVVAFNALRTHVTVRTKQAEALMRELVANLGGFETGPSAEG